MRDIVQRVQSDLQRLTRSEEGAATGRDAWYGIMQSIVQRAQSGLQRLTRSEVEAATGRRLYNFGDFDYNTHR